MDEMNYKPNSHAYKAKQAEQKAEEKVIEKVVSGPVKIKKKTGFKKLADEFIADGADNIKSHIRTNVIVPAIKDILEDVVVTTVRMLLRGETTSTRRGSTGSKISYGSFYEREKDRRSTAETRAVTRFDFGDIVFDSRGDAEAVLMQMDNVLERYKFVSVADLYDMANLGTPPHTAYKYGWTNINSSRVERTSDGFLLVLPKAMPLD